LLVGFAEGLGAAKTYAARQHHEVDTNRELLGVGAANLGAGLAVGLPSWAATTAWSSCSASTISSSKA
jgi:MFS superfamily sulfate permease-like transporter